MNSYAAKDSQERKLFRFSEILVLLEVFNHLTDIQNMKRHVFIFSLMANIICFWVIPYFNANDWVVYWVVIRSFRKVVRYFHRIYLDMGFRHEVYPLEWICITSLSFSFPLEYFNAVILILITFPIAKKAKSMKIPVGDFFTIDLSLTYLCLLYTSPSPRD